MENYILACSTHLFEWNNAAFQQNVRMPLVTETLVNGEVDRYKTWLKLLAVRKPALFIYIAKTTYE